MRIFKRGSTWYYTVEIPSDGGRKRKTKGGFKTQKQAKEAAISLEAEISAGGYYNESDMSLARCIELWLAEYKINSKSTTYRSAVSYCNNLLSFFPGGMKLKEMTRLKYQAYINSLDLKPNSLRRFKTIHGLIFKFAVRNELIRVNPISNIVLPKPKRTIEDRIEEKYLSLEELNKVLEASKASSYYIVMLCLAYTGMRIGEVTALQWSDIEGNVIHVRKNICTLDSVKRYQITTTKTKSSVRDIVISNTLVEALRKHKQEQRYKRMASKNWHDADFVFTSAFFPGYPIPRTATSFALQRAAERAGIEKKVNLHMLRHTHASLLAQAGVSLESIQERLGHASCEVTRQIYLHITKELKRDDADKFDRLMATIRQQ